MHPLVIISHRGWQKLRRILAVEFRVLGEKHLAHAVGAELGDDPLAPSCLTDQDRIPECEFRGMRINKGVPVTESNCNWGQMKSRLARGYDERRPGESKAPDMAEDGGAG